MLNKGKFLHSEYPIIRTAQRHFTPWENCSIMHCLGFSEKHPVRVNMGRNQGDSPIMEMCYIVLSCQYVVYSCVVVVVVVK